MSKIYKDRAVWLGTFLGGPLVAGYLISENYKTLNDLRRARLTWAYTIPATIALFALAGVFIVTGYDNDGAIRFIPILTVILASTLTRYLQGTQIDEFLLDGGEKHPWWRAIIIGLIGLAIFFVVMFFIALVLAAAGLISD